MGGTDGEIAEPVEDEPRHAELLCDIDGPREHHVGDDAVGAVAVDEPLKGLVEEGGGLVEGHHHLQGGGCIVETLAAVGEAGFGGGELKEVDGDIAVAREASLVDGGMDASGIEGSGDDGHINSLVKGEELGDVYQRNKVALFHQRQEEYVERTSL